MSIQIKSGKVPKKSFFLQSSFRSFRDIRIVLALFNSSTMTLKVISFTLSVELYALPGVTTFIIALSYFSRGSGMMQTGMLFQFQIEQMMKNSASSFDGLWFGKIWQTLATRMAQEIPPRYPIPFELMPLFLAHTLTSLRVCLKFQICFPVSSIIIRLFLRPSSEILLFSSMMVLRSSALITFSMSLGTVSAGS